MEAPTQPKSSPRPICLPHKKAQAIQERRPAGFKSWGKDGYLLLILKAQGNLHVQEESTLQN